MASFQLGEDDEVLSDINVTPLVDVMLVLLIIFMITAPMLHQGVEVALPQTQSRSLPLRDEDPLVLTLRKDGLVYVQDQPFHPSRLDEELVPLISSRGDEAVFVKADREVPYGDLMQVIDAIERGGTFRIGLVTDGSGARKR